MRFDDWHAGGARLRLGDRHAFVRISGDGPPLLFLHGFPTSSYDWSEVVPLLERQFRCIAFDFWGFGDSDPPARYDYDQQTELALAVAAHAGVTRACVVAHDYGVSVAEELLARQSPAFTPSGVVFLNGGVEPSLHRPIAIQRLLASPLGAILGPLLIRKSTLRRSMARILTRPERFDVDEHWRAISIRGGQRRAHALLHYIAERRRRRQRWVDAFADRKTPLAFAWGVRDPISGSHVLDWARTTRPDAECVALDVGHYPQLESPPEVAALIARFAGR